jgi:hypothetical protein
MVVVIVQVVVPLVDVHLQVLVVQVWLDVEVVDQVLMLPIPNLVVVNFLIKLF